MLPQCRFESPKRKKSSCGCVQRPCKRERAGQQDILLAGSAAMLGMTSRASSIAATCSNEVRCRRSSPTWRFGVLAFLAATQGMAGNPASPISRPRVSRHPFQARGHESLLQQPPTAPSRPARVPEGQMRSAMLGSALQRASAGAPAQASPAAASPQSLQPAAASTLLSSLRCRDRVAL